MESLRKTEEPFEVFQMVLRSLECHRPSKAEHDILDHIGSHYRLRSDRRRWPNELMEKRVSVEEFLKYCLDILSPFVEMVLDLYEFLYAYASTTGGRTQHFLIESEDLSKPWSFDVSRLPREVQWISTWMDTRIEEVEIDWEVIGHCLGIDNGVFYGSIDHIRLIQSLIIARREGVATKDLLALGDRIYKAVKRAARAWYHRVVSEITGPGQNRREDLQLGTYLPSIDRDFRTNHSFRNRWKQSGYVGICLDLALNAEPGSYTAAEVFQYPESSSDVTELMSDMGRNWHIQAAVFFCALWGLEDLSFCRIANLLRSHEEREDLLFGIDLDDQGLQLGELLISRLTSAVKPTGEVTYAREIVKQRLEILLLPYWKDRWFLFEVWTLIQVLRRGHRLGAQLDLKGVTAASDPNVVGTVWHLPTQKAKNPVAILSSIDSAILVWFQRETKRLDSQKNMEPDIRLTVDHEPYPDLAIVECKDRIKFRRSKSDSVVNSYLRGSGARLVWLVNYESAEGVKSRIGRTMGQSFGVTEGFRPHAVPSDFRASLDEIICEQLRLQTAVHNSDFRFLVIDVSGSMDGKRLPDSEVVQAFVSKRREFILFWSGFVKNADAEQWPQFLVQASRIHGSGAEDGYALAIFTQALPQADKLILITDGSGRAHLLSTGAIKETHAQDPEYPYSIAGRPVQIITV